MISAFAEASIILNNQVYADTAERSAEFILNNLMNKNRLLRTFKDGKCKLNGYLEDYAFFIEGLLELHETTLNPSWLNHAVNISKTMIDLFWDIKTEQFYDTSGDHEDLVIRPRDIADNAIPSGASTATAWAPSPPWGRTRSLPPCFPAGAGRPRPGSGRRSKSAGAEVGAGAGRTAKVILSINEDAKYVIADLPPAIDVSFKIIKGYLTR